MFSYCLRNKDNDESLSGHILISDHGEHWLQRKVSICITYTE